MKIGVYGDSYAHAGWSTEVWWQTLGRRHGHYVKSYGEAGSSIMYSSNLIEKNYHRYDLNIWCMTTPGRFSLQDQNQQWVHTTGVIEYIETQKRFDEDMHRRLQACKDYLKYIFDWDDEDFIGQAIANHHLEKGNVMIIPCFWSPLRRAGNLFEACSRETQYYFPGQAIEDVYQSWIDIRPAHFSPANNSILADMVNDNLEPGIFEVDLDQFGEPDLPLEQAFKPMKP